MVGRITRYREWAIFLAGLVLMAGLAGCGGGGGGGGGSRGEPPGNPPPGNPPPGNPPPPMPPATLLVAGTAHAGTPARPLAQAPCRFVRQADGQLLASATTDQAGAFELNIPVDQQGWILCHPAAIPSLELTAFLSTLAPSAGEQLNNEDVTPASAVIADVIRANEPPDPQARKEELLAALARGEAEITALVEVATLTYQTLFDAQAGSDASFSGEAEDGGAEADGGGVEGEAGDGGEFSPLPGAMCTFSLDAAGQVRDDTIMADLYADGQIDRLDLQEVAEPINNAIDAERRRAITQAFAALFPDGIGTSLATFADGADSETPGRYFLPVPAGVPGVVTCVPDTFGNLVLRTCVRARAPNEILEDEDVTPISTLVCEIANEAQQSGTTMDRENTTLDLFDRLAPLRIFLSEDRNGNGIQDPDERDKNGDGEFATIVELETDEPLTEINRDLALLASMSTTIFDTIRIERDDFEFDPSFDEAQDDFFVDGMFDVTFDPIAEGVESALNDAQNQEVLGTDDVVSASQTGTLQGRVTDVRGRPVGDVRVLVSQDDVDVMVPDNPAVTDADGRFRIRDIPVGDITVRAFLGEFEVLRVTTNVVAVVTVTLEIAPAPLLEASPPSLVFGDVELGSERELTVRLLNTGLADMTITGLVIEGEGAPAFRFRRRPVLPVVVSAGSEVTVDIGFGPELVDAALATLRVDSDAVNVPVLEVPLIGSGVERPVPQMELSRTVFTFGEVELNAFRTLSMVVSNSGTAPLIIRSVTIEAATGAGFILEQVPRLPATLPADGELPVRLRFQPTQVGVSRGIVRILSNSDERPNRTVALNGTGVDVPVPEISASPSVLGFGEAQINVPGEDLVVVTRTVTLRNTGTSDLTLTAARVDSSQGNEFRLPRPLTLPLTIIPGGGLDLDVQYRPTITGSVTGAVRIRSDAVNLDDLTIALNGTGVDTRVPKIAVSRSTLDYGEVEIGSVSRLPVDVTNIGTADLEITGFEMQSPEGRVFQLTRPPDTPFILVPGGVHRLRIRFRPNEEGYATGTFRILNNDAERPRRRISLRGEGVPVPIPQMVVSPEVASFGEVQVGSSRTVVITISNPGMAVLEITDFDGSVLGGEDFELRRPPRLPVPVRSESEVDIEVVFRPRRAGSVTGTLVIRGNAPETPMFTVPLHGTATPEPVPEMQVRPRTLDYGEVQERTSQTETVTIRNRGTADLVVRALSLTDRSSSDFEIVRAPQLPVTIVPGSLERVRVRYSPSAPGVASGVLRVTGNDPENSVARVSLNGIGTPEPTPQISVTPEDLAFGEMQEGERRRLTLTVRNTGTATLRLTDLVIDGDAFRLAGSIDLPIRIRTQSVKRLDMIYEPMVPGSDSGTLRIVNNSPETPEVVVALSGYAVPEPKPRIEVEPRSAEFGDVQIGSRRRLPIRIFNTGTARLDVTELRVDGGPSGTFTLDDNAAPGTVVEGGSIRVFVNFAPVDEGSVTGTLYVESNADNVDGIEVPLNGTGLPEPVPQIEAEPDIVEFPEVEIGESREEIVTIRNTGTGDLIVRNLDIDGGEDNEFRVRRAPSLPVTVLSEGSVDVHLAYVPANEGSATGTLRITSNDPENPAVILPLSGVGAPIPTPQVEASAVSLSFADVEVGSSRLRGVVITNVGNATLTIREINVASEPEGVFSLAPVLTVAGVSTDEIPVEPQSELPIDIVFAPDTPGLVTGTLQLMSDAANLETLTVSLEGVGTEAPMPTLAVSPETVDFGSLEIGRTRTLIVSMLNEGTADLTIDDLRLTAADGTSFQLDNIPELPAVVPPSNTVLAEIRFAPDTEGTATGTFRISSDDPENPETVLPVSGEALPEPVARIAVSPSRVRFGEVPIETSETMTLMIANEGNAELEVTGLTVNGGPNDVFRLGGGREAPFAVAAGEVETVDIVFAPAAIGAATGTVAIESNASNAPEMIVSLSGTGTAPQLTLNPETVNFGGVPVGSSRTIAVTVLNSGTAALVISAITVDGADFTLGAGAEAATLQPNDLLTFDVTYRPGTPGEASGVVRISNNTAGNPEAELRLSGRGTVPEVAVDPGALEFGNVVLEQSAVLPITITNVGEADLEIASVTAQGDAFSLSGEPAGGTTLSPGDALTFDARFAPLAVGEANGLLQIVSNDPASPTQVPLSGNGLPIPVLIDTSPEALAFGNLFLGDSAELMLTIANPGGSVLRVSDVRVSEGADVGFDLSEPFAGPVDVGPGDELTVVATFTPVDLGEVFGSVEIVSNADVGVVAVPLSGTGVAVPAPEISVTPMSWDFGEEELGSQQSLDIAIENTGNAPLTVTNIEMAEGADLGFDLQDAFSDDLVIQPGEFETVTVVYMPLVLGEAEGRLQIMSDAGDVDVTLNGVGVPVPVSIEVTPGELEFGQVFLGESRELVLTIGNPSDGDLSVSDIRIAEGGDDGFALSEAFAGPVDVMPGGAFPVTVTFTPLAEGGVSGLIEIESNADEGLVTVPLLGSGTESPTIQIGVLPEEIDFNEVTVNDTQTQELTLRNNGNVPMTVSAIALTSGAESGFAIVDGPGEAFEIVPGGSFVLTVAFTPVDEGLVEGNIQVTSDAENTPVLDVPLSGTGVPEPMALIEVQPADDVAFGNVELEQTRSLTVTISNRGDADLTLDRVSVPEGAEAGFALDGGPIEDEVLAPGDSLDVTLTFTPVDEGLVTGLFRVESNADNEPVVERPLSGTGTAIPVPVVTVTPEQIDFGGVTIGDQAGAEVRIENTGDADLTIEDVLIAEGAASGFGVTDVPDTPRVLAPGESLTVTAVFVPVASGPATGTLSVLSNASNGAEQLVPLQGTGVGVPELSVSPLSIDYGDVQVGEVATETVRIENTGTGELQLASVVINGDASFTLETELGDGSLAPGEGLNLEIAYRPTAEGESGASLDISSNAGDQSVSLRGNGTAAPAPAINVTPASWDFGEAELGSQQSLDIVIENTGNAPLTVTNIEMVEGVDLGFDLQDAFGDDLVIEPGDSEIVTVEYMPLVLGESEGRLQITSNAGDVDVTLNGVGVPVPVSIDVTPGELEFGPVFLGESRELVLTIGNPSAGSLSVSDIRIAEGGDAGFALSEAFAGPVDVVPGGEFPVMVLFTPLAEGGVGGAIEIESNADEGLVTVSLSGNGAIVPVPRLVVEPEAIEFGEITVEDTQTQELTLRNDGSAILTVNTIALTAGSEVGFTIIDGPGEAFEIMPGSSFVLTVALTPADADELSGNLRIESDSVDGSPTDVPLSGTGVPQPMALIEVQPADDVDFGNVQLEQTRSLTVTISNRGDADLTLDRVSVPEGTEAGFALDGGPIEDEVLAPGDSLDVTLTFTPVDEGPATGLFRVESNAENEPVVERPLSGTGTAIPLPAVTVTPNPVMFGSVNLGDQATAEVTIANTGDADLTIEDVLIAEGAASGFGVTDVPDTPRVLAPGESLTVTALFAPAGTGPATGTLSVLSDASNGAEQLVPLQGTGVGVPELSVSPSSIDYGDVQEGEVATETVRIENTGTGVLQLASVVINGDASFTLETELDDGSLAPGDILGLEIAYRPTGTGESLGSVDISSNAGDQSVSLRGNGTAAPAPAINVTPASWDFGEAELGSQQSLDIVIENTGNAPLTITNIEITQGADLGFALQDTFGDDLVIQPGDSETVLVVYAPLTVGESEGRLTVESDAGDVDVTLNGVGISVPVSIDVIPGELEFGQVFLGESRELALTIGNPSAGDLSVSDIRMAEGTDASFTLSEAFAGPVDVMPGGEFPVTVTFTPLAEGDVGGSIEIESNADEGLVTVSLSGNGATVPVPRLVVEPEVLDFGEITVDDTLRQPLILRNDGDGPLTVDEMRLTSGDDAGFAVVDGPSEAFEIVPGGSFEALIALTPANEGELSGNIRIESDSVDGSPTDVPLSGMGVARPMALIEVQPSDDMDFGNVELEQDRSLTVTISNRGDADLTLDRVSVPEGGDAGFALDSGTIEDDVLAPGDSLDVTLTFTPVDAGPATGLFRVESNAENEPVVERPLRGTGTAIPVPVATVTPQPVMFGPVAIGDQATAEVTIANTGDADLTIEDVLIAEGSASGFGVTDIPDTPSTLSPGESLTVTALFAPVGTGPATGTLSVLSDASNGAEQLVPLQGTGVGVPELSVSPSSIDYGDVQEGEVATETVRIENTGTGELQLASVVINGDASFTLETELGDGSLAPGEGVNLEIAYRPTDEGESSGSLEIASNGGDQSVSLRGNGTAAPAPAISVTPTSWDFGEAELGSQQSLDIVIENTGNAPLTVTNIEITQGAALGFALQDAFGDDLVIQPGDSETVTVVYAAQAVGESEGRLTIESDAGSVDVSFNGVGVAVPVSIDVTPDELEFGQVFLGESRELALTIGNSSDGDLSVSDIRMAEGTNAGFALNEAFAGPVDVMPGGEFPVTIVFTPLAEGDVVGSIEIESNADEGLVTVSLSGNGATVPVPRLVVEPEAIDFGEITVDDTLRQTLTLRNDGDGPLTVDEMSLTSGDDAGFTIVDGPSEAFEIVPGGSFEVVIALTPADEGELSGNLRIESDSVDGSPTDVPLRGMGVAQPMALIEVQPADDMDFGNVELEQDRSLTVTITNRGDADLTLDRVSVPEGSDVGFALDGGPIEDEVLAPGDSLDVTLTFTPIDEGLVTGLFRIESNADNEPVVERPLRGTGTAIPVPVVTVTPEQVRFGDVDIGDEATAEVRIENTGDADLTVEDILIAEGASSGFGVSDVPGLPSTLSPGESMTVTAAFTPEGTGPSTGTLSVLSDASNGAEQMVSLQGTGVNPPAPAIEVSPQDLAFGGVPLGGEETLSFTINNPGDAVLELTVTLASSAGDGVFSLDNVPSEIDASDEASVRVRFSPSSVGDVSARVRIMSNADPDEIIVEVSGTGVGEAELSVSPSSIDYGDVEEGDVVTETVRIENTGTGTLQLESVMLESVVMNGEAAFTLETELGDGSLAPGDVLRLEIAYRPTGTGEASGSLEIASNAGSQSVSLRGNGVPVPEPQISVTPTSWDFGEVEQGFEQLTDINIENTGNAPLTVTNIEITQGADLGFALQDDFSDDLVIQPGESEAVTVVYSPQTVGEAEGRLTIESDAGDVDVDLNGAGAAIPVSIEVSPGQLGFEQVFLGESRELVLTISNPSDGGLIVSDIRIVEGGDAGFELSERFSGPVDVRPGSEFPVSITFTPQDEDDVSGSIEIESNADEGLVTIALSGRGETVPVPRLVVEPEAIDFGEVTVDDAQRQTLTLRNEGDGLLTVDEIRLTSGDDLGFAIVDRPGEAFEIVPGGSFEVVVTLTPTDEDDLSGNIRITSDAENDSTLDVPLSGTGVAQPMALIEVQPADDVAFGNVELEQTRSLTVTIFNRGDADLALDRISVPEGGDAGFAIDGGTIEDDVLAPGDSLDVTLTFSPVDTGLAAGLFRVQSNAENEPVVERPLRGTGTAIPVPVVTVTPEQVRFGDVDIGDEATAEVRIENTGDADLTVEDILIAEGASSGFGVSDVPGLPRTLAPGESMTVTAAFMPEGTGAATGTLSVLSDASNGAEQIVSLQGTGVGVPLLSVSPSSIDYGDVQEGDVATETVRIENTGTGVLQVESVEINGDAAFTLETGLGDGRLAPGDVLRLEIAYRPTGTGESSGSLEIASNAGDQSVSLSGNGVPAPEPRIEVSPGNVGFGSVDVGDTLTADLTIESTGDAALVITEIAFTGNTGEDFELQGGVTDEVELAPGDQLVITVRFTPTSAVDASGGVRIVSNAANDATIVVDIDGTGVPIPVAEIEVTPTELDFGNVLVEESGTEEVRIRNTGTLVLNVDALVISGDTDVFAVDADATGPFAIEPGDEVVVPIIFSPVETGEANATLEINSNANETPATAVRLRGDGGVATIDVQSADLIFDPQELGQSQTLLVTVFNGGTAALDLTSVSIDEPNFTLGAVSERVDPGATGTIEIIFRPDRDGGIFGELTIENDSENAPVAVVNLMGTGVVPAGAGLFVGPTMLTFGETAIDEPVTVSVTVHSVGLTNVTVSGLALAGVAGFALSAIPDLPMTLAPGETATIEIVFMPTEPGPFSELLLIESDDENNPVIMIPLDGTGIEAMAASGLRIQ